LIRSRRPALLGALLSAFLLTSPGVSGAVCTGDCDGSGEVTIPELVTLVDIALDGTGTARCEAGDANGDGVITIEELITAVTFALDGCPATPTATAAASATPPPSPTATASPIPSASASPMPTESRSPAATPTASSTPTDTAVPSPTESVTAAPSGTPSGTAFSTATSSPGASATASNTAAKTTTSPTAGGTRSGSPTLTASATHTPAFSQTPPPSVSATGTPSRTTTATATAAASGTRTATTTRTATATHTHPPTATASATMTPTPTRSATPTRTATRTATATNTTTPTRSATATRTPPPSSTASATRPPTATLTPTFTATSTPGLGTRHFTIDPQTSLLRILPDLGDFTGFSGSLDLAAGVPDPVTGLALVNIVSASEFLSVQVGLQTLCIKPIVPVTKAGVLSCSGGVDLGITSSEDHNIGTVGVNGFTADDCMVAGGTVEGPSDPHPGVCNGPVEIGLSGVDSGVGALLIAPDDRFGTQGLPAEVTLDTGPCDQHTGGEPALFGFTSGLSTATISDANNVSGATLTHAESGENFSCPMWMQQDGPGRLVLSVPAVDGSSDGDVITAFVLND
jgi:hypothetical protein